ncbi:MAG TPA: aminoglycoside phosphotransferase family protein [Conexibacter sp.]|nr:aminoglycoside phosphotransferase family protein [Conexibacter sp.]
MLVIPDKVAQVAVRDHGAAGRAWLAALPLLVERLADAWSLRLDTPLHGGWVALVYAVTREQDGSEAVLKLSIVDEETRGEAAALRHWDGRGAVRLLDDEPAHGALLLERIRPGTSLLHHPDLDEACSIACGVLRRVWGPPPVDHELPLATDLAARWAEQLVSEFGAHGRPFADTLLDEAVALCRELAQDPSDVVVANRDLHRGNVLAAEREPWLLIDPKPLVGERAFDTAHLLRDLLPAEPQAGDVSRLVARLADELALEPQRIRAWTFVRTIENALWSIRAGEPSARDIAIAEQLAMSGAPD